MQGIWISRKSLKISYHIFFYKLKQLVINGQVSTSMDRKLIERQTAKSVDRLIYLESITRGAPQDLVFCLVHFIIYINDVDVELSNVVSKFFNDVKIGNLVLTSEDTQSRLHFH